MTDKKKRAELYEQEEIFTFVRELQPSGKEFQWRGFVVGVKEEIMLFFDVQEKKEMPLLFDDIDFERCSKSEIPEEEARRRLEVYKNGGS